MIEPDKYLKPIPDLEVVLDLAREFLCLVEDHAHQIPYSYWGYSFTQKGIIIKIKESCALTDYARYLQGDNTLFIESSVITTRQRLKDMFQYYVDLEQQRKNFKIKGE